ncbi:hypothetical protein [Methylobacterium haplocladii]|uniref:Lipoprotein n=1 Tax=Methylobacterium haplocladii TaxID=1176176 RepID=A0A512ITA8_9HYPH|nr:hypothetical protein [Methylobacterium haplocladii]GEP00940.1 hypothetical protein MHA02_33270 [Methylobacterium haplocladii]GJD84896.1 hypothetical protein HPGCJGGD_2779 [Methylobacterium haplocladii]GLS59839.1 hypothetical protein GCM10007887_25120 [Methylobacterium haplocladii]
MRLVSSRASKLLAAAALASLLAACQSGRTQVASLEGYTPDPALKTASKSNLKGRVSHACVVTQARFQKVAEASVEQPCGCYADRTLSSLDGGEIQSYRATGYFNDSAKAKALNALDSCKLPRPA